MAYAFRLGDPRVAYIRLSRADIGEASAGAELCFAIRLGDEERPLRGALRQDMITTGPAPNLPTSTLTPAWESTWYCPPPMGCTMTGLPSNTMPI